MGKLLPGIGRKDEMIARQKVTDLRTGSELGGTYGFFGNWKWSAVLTGK